MVDAGAVVAGGSGAAEAAVVGLAPAVGGGATSGLLQANATAPSSSTVSVGSERAGPRTVGRLSWLVRSR